MFYSVWPSWAALCKLKRVIEFVLQAHELVMVLRELFDFAFDIIILMRNLQVSKA